MAERAELITSKILLLLVYGLVRSPIWVHEGELMYIGKSPKENP